MTVYCMDYVERVIAFDAEVERVAANGAPTVAGIRYTAQGVGFGSYRSRHIRRPTEADRLAAAWRARADAAATQLRARGWSVSPPLGSVGSVSDELVAKAREAVLQVLTEAAG